MAAGAIVRLRGQRQDERQRAGPERLGEPVGAGVEGGDAAGGVAVGYVRDQRVVRRAPLRAVDGRDGARVAGERAEAVDGLGREGDEAAGP